LLVDVVRQGLGPAYLRRPEAVETGIDDDAVAPGRDGGLTAERVRPAVRRDHAVLQAVGRVMRIAHRAQGHGPQPVAVPGEEPAERLGVTSDVSGEQLGVGGLVSHP